MNTNYIKSQNTFIPIYNEIGEVVNRNPTKINLSKNIIRINQTRFRVLTKNKIS